MPQFFRKEKYQMKKLHHCSQGIDLSKTILLTRRRIHEPVSPHIIRLSWVWHYSTSDEEVSFWISRESQLLGTIWLKLVAHVRVPPVGQGELFKNHFYSIESMQKKRKKNLLWGNNTKNPNINVKWTRWSDLLE